MHLIHLPKSHTFQFFPLIHIPNTFNLLFSIASSSLSSQLRTLPSWGLPAGVMPLWTPELLHVACLQSQRHTMMLKAAACLNSRWTPSIRAWSVKVWVLSSGINCPRCPCMHKFPSLLKGKSSCRLYGFCNPWWSMGFALKASFPVFPVRHSWHLFKELISSDPIFLAYHFQPMPFPTSLHDFPNLSTLLFSWL